MVTTRTPKGRPPRGGQITPEAIELFRRGLQIQERGLDEEWEEDGGRRREYLDLSSALAAALGRNKPWLPCVLDVGEDVPAWVTDRFHIENERAAIALRKELLAAIEQE